MRLADQYRPHPATTPPREWLTAGVRWKAGPTMGGGGGATPKALTYVPGQSLLKGCSLTEHAVVVAGGGPTGLMLAGELALAGIDVAIVERRITQEITGSRAGGLHARTIEVLDQRGIAERFLTEGKKAQVAGFAWFPLDISDFPTRHNYGLGLWQEHIERLLAGWVEELRVPIYRGREVTGFSQDDTGVDVAFSDGESVRAEYLVGCDGGKSVVRKTAGIEFAGWDASTSHLIAEVALDGEAEWGLRRDAFGIHSLSRMENGLVRVLVTEQQPGRTSEPTLADLTETLVGIYGTDFGIHSPTWISRFTDMARQAATYRQGRVLLAGDAAHVHYPTGGQGVNIGIQDAVNLGWKLGQVVRGISPESLLDTYQAERHPIAARVLRDTMAQVALLRTDDRTNALRDVFSGLITLNEPRKQLAGMMSGLDVKYDLGEGHPLLGRRIPDLAIGTDSGSVQLFTLLHDARPVLLNLGQPGSLDITQWTNRVGVIEARYAETWELPVLGQVSAPTAVLIRPDGYVAWVGEGRTAGLHEAIAVWC
jgi:3-(3-hydroxy-phenyl)propionate hydroxylase